MKRVVLTGGAGFIGSHLADELVERDYFITVLDDLSSGQLENLEELRINSKKVEFIQGTITDLSLLKSLFNNSLYVFHQAAIPSVPRSVDDPISSHEVNLTGTLNVLIAARDCGVKKVVYASSSSAYGDTPTLPKHEDMIPHPQSPYAVTKLAGEYYCDVFQETYGLSTACLRYFNVYGPRQNPDSQYAAVIPKFVRSALDENSPVIFGDGEQTRDFTFVKDVANMNILAAENQKATGIFNVGTGESISINQLARLIVEIIGKDVQPEHLPERTGDIKHSLADISRAKRIGHTPKYNLRQGLTETIRATIEKA
ncbi:MAG: SDR family oxidoreductase [Chloroflexota bacterium]|nr:SDR family oxidoreductase [Chloroflexota bacterium]